MNVRAVNDPIFVLWAVTNDARERPKAVRMTASPAALSKAEVEAYLSSVDLRTCLEGALNAAVAARAADPPAFFRDYFINMVASDQGTATTKWCAPLHARSSQRVRFSGARYAFSLKLHLPPPATPQ
jgi:hypothetical protein